MSPLLFPAIAVAVPLLGMIALGLGARIKRQKVTDDQTEPFRRKLASLAPLGRPEQHADSPRTPGLAGTARRRRSSGAVTPSPGPADAAPGYEPAPLIPAQRQPATTSVRLIEHAHPGQIPPLRTESDEQRRRPAS